MPQGQVIDAIGEHILPTWRREPMYNSRTPVAVHGLPAFGVQMSHGGDGHGPFHRGCFSGPVVDPPVMALIPSTIFRSLVLDALSGLGGADVPVPEIGDGADDQPGLAIRSLQHDDFIIG